VPGALALFIGRRILHTLALVVVATSAALVLVYVGDPCAPDIGADPRVAAAECARLGLDRPLGEQYVTFMTRALTLDFGESAHFNRPVAALLGERIGNTVLLGITALVLALGIGLPAGVYTASAPASIGARIIRAAALLLVSAPPLVTALVLLMIAARTGLFPAGGFDVPSGGGALDWLAAAARYLPLPALALALPTAASLERVQSRAMEATLTDPSILAARARGVPIWRTTWVHAWRLALPPVLGMLGVVLGSVLSGSLIVEIVMSWPGLGQLMHQALIARDMYLAAGCAAAGALFLALGISASECALQVADPRRREPA
jgi:peptide/nickel transport system permease protein